MYDSYISGVCKCFLVLSKLGAGSFLIFIHHFGFCKVEGRLDGYGLKMEKTLYQEGEKRKGKREGKKNIFRNEFVGAGRGYCFLTAGVQQSTKAGGRGPFRNREENSWS